ncbi:ABC transporter substrate-binding protein [Enemella sp. A6]|uniref:ABC transporter substrate-binding protein n=1 Tax=Enemella sp. A6 TaxID=3440152 RepID=UPI003EC063D4
MRRSWPRVVALLVAGGLAFSACARDAADPRDNPTHDGDTSHFTPGVYEESDPGEPTSGGTLTFAAFSEARSLDPTKTIATGYSGGNALVAVYDQLVRWNVREEKFEPRLAESVEPNDDHTEWTITLREGATFSDGTPVNADAVVGSFEYYVKNKGFDMAVIGPLWGGAEKVDDRTVRVNLTESWATFPFALGLGMGFIVAPAAIEKGPEGFTPIGAGPFTLDSYSPTEELVLAKNPKYWDGEPHLDKLRFVWLGADQTKYESLNGDQVQAAVIRDVDIIKKARDADLPGWVSNDNVGTGILVNRADGRPAGEYPEIVLAMAHAIDEKALYDRVFDGLGLPSKHLFGPQSPWHHADAKSPEYDPDKATELLNKAKEKGFDGRIVNTTLATPVSRDQAMIIKAQLEAVGFTVENDFIRTVADHSVKTQVERDFDVNRSAQAITDIDPYWRLYSAFHSSSVANISSYHDPEMDKLIDELREAAGDDRADVLRRVEEKVAADMPVIPLGAGIAMVGWTADAHGINPTNDGMVGFEKAWLSKK